MNNTGATVAVDYITFPETSKKLNMLAKQGKIRVVAGPVTRDMTGKARPMEEVYFLVFKF